MNALIICFMFLGAVVASPLLAHAQNTITNNGSTNIDNKKADVAQKFQAKIDKENQSYENRKNELQDKYKDNPDKLNQELDKLRDDHNKKLEKLDNKLKDKENKLNQ
jgi:hypothetical protein